MYFAAGSVGQMGAAVVAAPAVADRLWQKYLPYSRHQTLPHLLLARLPSLARAGLLSRALLQPVQVFARSKNKESA